MHSRGIILKKHFPHRVHISILDETRGHISVMPEGWRWASYACPGAVVSYDMDEKSGSLRVKNIELVWMPSYREPSAQLFLHHVLELCYVFLPVCSSSTESFVLLAQLLSRFDQLCTQTEWQTCFVAKLLFTLGAYPPESAHLAISSSLSLSYDSLIESEWTKQQRNELEIFIYQCLNNHPYGQWLKTINFLMRVDQ